MQMYGLLRRLKNLAAELDVGKGIAATVASIKNSKGESALHLGAAEGNGDICKYLINDLKLDVHIKDNKGATLGGHLGTAVYLLKKGANPNSADDSGFTPLHNAAEIGFRSLKGTISSPDGGRDIPMDYEDNNFHSQTFQLAGEENIKFSTGLHSYSLPKFDLDDSLQTRLRFDSLVDSEALLGIHGQEENHWIEDFLHESSGLEFSSSAVESCSILRRDNVWSEATSSVSVDLILKSVGRDDMKIMERPIIEESDICDGLDCLTNQMKHNMDREASKTESVTCVDSTSPLESLDRFSGLDMGAMDQVPSIDSNTLEGEGERSVDGGSRALSVIEEECRESLVSNENLDVAKLKENTNLFDKSQGNMSAVTSQCMDVNTSTALVQTFVNAGVGNCHQVPQRAGDLGKGDDSIVGDHHVLSRLVDGQTSEGHVDHDHDKNMGNPSSWVEKVESMLQVPELSSDSNFTQNTVDSGKDEHIASSKEIDMVDNYIGNPQEASLLVVGGVDTAEISASASGNLSMQRMPICVQTAQECSNSESLL